MQSEHVSKLVRIPGIVTAASKPKVSLLRMSAISRFTAKLTFDALGAATRGVLPLPDQKQGITGLCCLSMTVCT